MLEVFLLMSEERRRLRKETRKGEVRLGRKDGSQTEIAGTGFTGLESLFLGTRRDTDDFLWPKQFSGLLKSCRNLISPALMTHTSHLTEEEEEE